MKRASLVIALVLGGAARGDEVKWSAAVPLWKCISPKGRLVAAHPGPVWTLAEPKFAAVQVAFRPVSAGPGLVPLPMELARGEPDLARLGPPAARIAAPKPSE